MKTRTTFAVAFIYWLIAGGALGILLAPAAEAQQPSTTRILVIAGPCQHPPGTHEAAAGARLLEYCIKHAEKLGPVDAECLDRWPAENQELDDVAAIVFIGDIFPPERMEEPERIKSQLAKLMDRGCGLVCIHYATGLRGADVAEDGDHPLLRWMGGYFATGGCTHHRSVARVCSATLSPEETDHPILRGWQSFTFDDEPYWNNYFGKDGFAPNVTPLVYTMLPPDKPKKETVAWAVEREDGGRGVGIVVPHFYRNWQLDDLRTLVLNSVTWSAGLEVPAEGVKTSLPDLSTFSPDAVQPQPRRKKPASQ
jgi:hypothetical protein